MPVTPQDRPIDAVREETVDQLIMNYGHGKLSREAFERRLDEALDAKSHDRLVELTSDLDLKADRQYTAQKKAELGIRIDPSAASQIDNNELMINVFGGNTRRGAWDVPRAIRIVSIFGGADLDFTDARFTADDDLHHGVLPVRRREHPRARRDALDLEGVCIFGGVDNRGRNDVRPERAGARHRGRSRCSAASTSE